MRCIWVSDQLQAVCDVDLIYTVYQTVQMVCSAPAPVGLPGTGSAYLTRAEPRLAADVWSGSIDSLLIGCKQFTRSMDDASSAFPLWLKTQHSPN